jgi:hypothetical protein
VLFWIEWLAATRKSAFDAPYRRLQDRCLWRWMALQGMDEEGADRFIALQSNHYRWTSRECREVEKWSVGDGKELSSGEVGLQDIIYNIL